MSLDHRAIAGLGVRQGAQQRARLGLWPVPVALLGTIQERLQAVLADLAPGGAWPLIAAQGTAGPYIVWTTVVTVPETTLGGASALRRTRFQIDCYARAKGGVVALAASVAAVMTSASFASVPLSEQNLFEPDTRLFRISMDFAVWSP